MLILKPNFKKRGGVIPVVVQEADTRKVLIVAYTNEACFLETVKTRQVVLYSTSRQKRWKKGEGSGDILHISDPTRQILVDCDGDALIYLVRRTVPTHGVCHTGADCCFFRAINGDPLSEPINLGEKEYLETIEI